MSNKTKAVIKRCFNIYDDSQDALDDAAYVES